MKEITAKLHEKRQIELAKSILESHGYKVVKALTESLSDKGVTDEQKATLEFIEEVAGRLGVDLSFYNRTGKYPPTVILHHYTPDTIISVDGNGSCVINGEEIGSWRDKGFDIHDYEYEVEEAFQGIVEEDEMMRADGIDPKTGKPLK